jgi:two-component system, chemotaxis family, chemotaxis protein CheY
MINLEEELAQDYLEECHEHMAAIEASLLALETASPNAAPDEADRAFRALHWIQGGASVFELESIGQLARQMQWVLGRVRARELAPTPALIRVLLRAKDRLRELVENPGSSNTADLGGILAALTAQSGETSGASASGREATSAIGRPLKLLLAEDDFASRLLLQTYLSKFGECHVAVNGAEAVQAFRMKLERGERYDLICMDIMMPEMDGREAVRQIRALEEEHGILSTAGVKIVMTTAVDDVKEVIRCFHELCDAYLVKPIDLAKLEERMRAYNLAK